MFIQNFCSSKADQMNDEDFQDNSNIGVAAHKRSKTAAGARRSKMGSKTTKNSNAPTSQFERAPIFQEIYEL